MSLPERRFGVSFTDTGQRFAPGFSGTGQRFSLGLRDVQAVTERDYERLDNKPQINDVTLIGNKTSLQLDLQDRMDTISNMDIEALLNAFV